MCLLQCQVRATDAAVRMVGVCSSYSSTLSTAGNHISDNRVVSYRYYSSTAVLLLLLLAIRKRALMQNFLIAIKEGIIYNL